MSTESIAIVGASCTLAGKVTNIDSLYKAFAEGRDCVTEIPADRWDVDAFYDPDPLRPGKMTVRHGSFVSDVECFDAGFFGISEAEAAAMDPQQRLLLQTVWHALENGGQDPAELSGGNTGVFLAAMNTNSYVMLKERMGRGYNTTPYDAIGDALSIAAGRVAHFLDIGGPCFTVDTACSGGLLALHLARQSLLSGECDSAIVAGVNLILCPDIHIRFSKVGLLSQRGQCRAFDADADGYVRSEGCVALFLRRESVALERRDRILASVVTTAVNHDGRSAALTQPNGRAQERLIRIALSQGGLDPADIGYVEAHGTGTYTGDPIEMRAIAAAYGQSGPSRQPLFVGSSKSNFGHIEAGAGLLGLLKAALSIQRGEIFPSLHFDRLNPKIDLTDTGIQVPGSVVPWPAIDVPRMAGVNSFGYSGTNVHAIVREAPAPEPGPVCRRTADLFVLSAKSQESLDDLAGRWADFLADAEPGALPDAVFTAAMGRAALRERLAVTGASPGEVAESLRRWRSGRGSASVAEGRSRAKNLVAFVFTGQGSQYAGMARLLDESEPVFAAAIDKCAAIMDDHLTVPLRTLLYGREQAGQIDNTRFAQPALFAVEYAIAELLGSWAIKPALMIGHSIGELTAATLSGMLSLQEAARFVVLRGELMGALPRDGKMVALSTDPDTARTLLAGREADVAIAAVNGPRSVSVAGKASSVDEVVRLADRSGIRVRELKVSHAFHSPLMDPVLDRITQAATAFTPGKPAVPVVSNVTGEFLTGDEDARYWGTQLREPVRFYQGMQKIMAEGCTAIVEIGPHPALTPVITGAFGSTGARLLPTLLRDGKDVKNILTTAGTLWTLGVPVQLGELLGGQGRRRVPAPEYPFRKTRYWLDGRLEGGESIVFWQPGQEQPEQDEPGQDEPLDPDRVVVSARETTLTSTAPWADHQVLETTIFPASGYLEMTTRAFADVRDDGSGHPVSMTDISFLRPLVMTPARPTTIRVVLEKSPRDSGADPLLFTLSTQVRDGQDSAAYCRGSISPHTGPAGGAGTIDLAALRSCIGEALSPRLLYGNLRQSGMEYGASFSTVREAWTRKEGHAEAIGRVAAAPDGAPDEGHEYRFTTMLDGCFHIVGAALANMPGEPMEGAFVPASIKRLTVNGAFPAQVWAHAEVQINESGSAAVARIEVVDGGGTLVAEVDGLELRHITSLKALAEVGKGRAPGSGRRIKSRRMEFTDRLMPLPRGERIAVINAWLSEEILDTLGSAASELDIEEGVIDPSMALLEVGLDSLMITELQRRIQETLEFRFDAMEALDYQSMEDLCGYILDRVLAFEPTENPAEGIIATCSTPASSTTT